MDGFIRIWNFHSGELLDKTQIGAKIIRGNFRKLNNIETLCAIYFWNDKYLIAACNNSINIVELENLKVYKIIRQENIIAVQKIILPKLGEYLITQGIECSNIKLWTITNF